jgi:hypothetical protein
MPKLKISGTDSCLQNEELKPVMDNEKFVVKIEGASEDDTERYVPKTKKQLCMEKLKPYIEEETKIVKGIFRNYETPGASAPIQVIKYPGIPGFQETMTDNETYEIPLYVARFLNGTDITAKGCDEKIHTCSYETHGFLWSAGAPMPRGSQDDKGIPVPIIGVAKRTRRYGFESLQFN